MLASDTSVSKRPSLPLLMHALECTDSWCTHVLLKVHWQKVCSVPKDQHISKAFLRVARAGEPGVSFRRTCRDVKLENLLVRTGGLPQDGTGGAQALHLRLIDFGSALDPHSLRSLYGEEGPSAEEQTMEYAPPEALLGR